MKKRLLIIIPAILFLMMAAAGADLMLPASVTDIEEEAFMGNLSLTGVLTLPEGVQRIGKDAFSQTNLFALVIPEKTESVGSQSLEHAAYVRVMGSETELSSISGVQYLIAPKNSKAQEVVTAGQDFVPEAQLEEHGGFYYVRTNTGLTLLSAVNPAGIGTEILIPDRIVCKGTDGDAVYAETDGISPYAFMGCSDLTTISLPGKLKGNPNIADAIQDCPNATVTFSGNEEGLSVKAVTANAEAGTAGDSITWTVEATSDQPILTYRYTLTANGQIIETLQSNSPTFTRTFDQPGAYKLAVEATDAAGRKGSAESRILYIAVESMTMTVPEELANGEDLTIQVEAVENAHSYSIYLTNDTTGEYVSYRRITKAGSITIKGYLLEAGTLRVTGYVYGNDFRYSVPTVKTVTVSGEKADGPIITPMGPIYYGRGGISFRLSDTEPYAVKIQYCYTDGTTREDTTSCEAGDECQIWADGNYEQWAQGGAIRLQGAVQHSGVWTDWGEVTEVSVLPAPILDSPVLTAPETAEAGKDLTVSFESVENGDQYRLQFIKGFVSGKTGDFDNEHILFNKWYNRGSTAVIPGCLLEAGDYTLYLFSRNNTGEYMSSDPVIQRIEVTGNRPQAPEMTANVTEQAINGSGLVLSFHAPGADGVTILMESRLNGQRTLAWDPVTASVDEEGYGRYSSSWNMGEDLIGQTMRYRVSAIIDGVWSELSEPVDILITATSPLPQPAVIAPASLAAGEDYTFSFAPVEGATRYEASLKRAYGNDTIRSWYGDNCHAGQDMTVPGYLLTQGSYRLTVEAYSNDRGSSETTQLLTVSGNRPTAPAVTGYPAEAHIRDKLTFNVDTDGAEKLAIDYTGRYANGSMRYGSQITQNPTGKETLWQYTLYEDALDMTFTFRFAVKKNGIWSAWQSVEMTILDLPQLEPVVIHAQETYEAGKNFTITYDAVEHATGYQYRLYRDDDSYTSNSESVPKDHTYYGYNYEPGTYRVRVTASSDAYRSSTAEYVFTIAGTKADAPEVSADRTEVTGEETFTFTIDTTDAEELKCRKGYPESFASYGLSSEITSINVLENTTRWTTYNNNGIFGTCTYSFSMRVGDCWTAWSTPIAVSMLSPEILPAVTVNVPATLSTGQDLNVTVGGAEGARQYAVTLYNNSGTRVDRRSIYTGEGGTLTFEGFLLPAGRYRILAEAYTNSGSSEAEAYVTVSAGERPKAPAVTPETDLGRVNVAYGFLIDTEDAEATAVRYYREGYTNNVIYRTISTSGNETRWTHSNSIAGETWRYAFAVKKDGIWSTWSSVCSVTITDREILEKVTLQVPETLEAGSDLYLSFTGVEHADTYEMCINYPDGSSRYWTVYPDTPRRITGYDLTPGTYRISVTASGAEYGSSTAEQNISVTGVRGEAPECSVSSTEVFTDETYTFMIGSKNAQEIAYRSSYGSSSFSGTLNVLTDTTVWDTYMSRAGTVSYTFCALRNGKWSAWSTPVTITVNTRPELPLPSVTVPETVERGRNLTVTVGEADGATDYYVYLYDNRGESVAYKHSRTPGEFVLPGYRLSAGSMQIKVILNGPNGGSRTVTSNLRVIDAELPEAPQVIPPEQTTVSPQTYYLFGIETVGAEKVAVRYYRVGSPNDVVFQEFNVSSDGDTTSWRQYQYSGGNTYAYSFAVQKDGVWSQWSSFTEITIE